MSIESDFEAAKLHAQVLSAEHHCVQHVNAVLEVHGGVPVIFNFTISDWHDGTTLASYNDGVECQ